MQLLQLLPIVVGGKELTLRVAGIVGVHIHPKMQPPPLSFEQVTQGPGILVTVFIVKRVKKVSMVCLRDKRGAFQLIFTYED